MTRVEIEKAEYKTATAIILDWQKKAFFWLLVLVLLTGFIRMIVIFFIYPDFAPLGNRLFAFGIYLFLIVIFLFRRLNHRLRVWFFLFSGYALASLMFISTGLQGSGRLFLAVLPMYALVLIGRRSSLTACIMSVAMFCLAAIMDPNGMPYHVWMFQGVVFFFSFGAIMILMYGFVSILFDTLTAEIRAKQERVRLERLLVETAEQERRAVGQQLHDGPCQQLTAALLRCKYLENMLTRKGLSVDEITHVLEIAKMIDESSGEIHDIARGLSPTEIEPGAFAAAIGDLVKRVTSMGQVQCKFIYDSDANPGAPVSSTQLFLVIQEAVNNALKHADATRITIEFSNTESALKLQVKDDGKGINDELATGGLGLLIMRHRIELLGGSFSISSGKSSGTCVCCLVPHTLHKA